MTATVRTIDIRTIWLLMCPCKKKKIQIQKESYNCTDADIYVTKTSHLGIKQSASIKANISMHIKHDNEWGMEEVAKR